MFCICHFLKKAEELLHPISREQFGWPYIARMLQFSLACKNNDARHAATSSLYKGPQPDHLPLPNCTIAEEKVGDHQK